MSFEVFEHTADLGLRVRASSLRELFVDAARGLVSMIVANPGNLRSVVEERLHLEGDDRELLFFDWLSEILYTFETKRILFAEFDVAIDDADDEIICLAANCGGERADENRHQLEHEVKAITYHGLRVEHVDGEWMAEVIVDI